MMRRITKIDRIYRITLNGRSHSPVLVLRSGPTIHIAKLMMARIIKAECCSENKGISQKLNSERIIIVAKIPRILGRIITEFFAIFSRFSIQM